MRLPRLFCLCVFVGVFTSCGPHHLNITPLVYKSHGEKRQGIQIEYEDPVNVTVAYSDNGTAKHIDFQMIPRKVWGATPTWMQQTTSALSSLLGLGAVAAQGNLNDTTTVVNANTD